MLKTIPKIQTKISISSQSSSRAKTFCSIKQSSKVTKVEPLAEGRFLRLIKVHYQDEKNQNRVWEALERKTKGTSEVDAVEIVPILKTANQHPQLVALKQFRPPAGQYVIELPAGLVDKGEKPVDAALRELKEETGYTGKVLHESVATMFGMAINNITSKIVLVEIDGSKPENQNPKQHLEGEEQAEVVHIPMHNIVKTIEQYKSQGYGVDGKIAMLAIGMQVQ